MYVLLFPLHWEFTRLLYFIKIVFWDTGDAVSPPHPPPAARVCARFEPVVSNSCSTSGSSGEDTRDLGWVFKAGEEVYGERYWLIFMGAVGDGDFWLFDWRIAQEMRELKCVARCRRNVMGLHLWPTFRVDILKSFSKEYLI